MKKFTAFLTVVLILLTYVIITHNVYQLSVGSLCGRHKPISYEYVEKNAKTGDILLTRSDYLDQGNVISYFRVTQQTLFDTIYGHASLIIRYNDKLYAYSFNTSEHHDVVSGKHISGVQITPLEPYIKNYRGMVFFYPLKNQYEVKKTDKEMFDYASERVYQQKPRFKAAGIPHIATFLGDVKCEKEIKKYVICSQVVADALQFLGIIEDSICPNHFTMKDMEELVNHREYYKYGYKVSNNYTDGRCNRTTLYDKYRLS